ncbi:MAG TPA: PIG-L family deacetylase [Rhodanobacteraceae bacterium]|nr:PIG-L family deacetylase [Rhodanobacteraceae bacterium]
MSVVDVQHPWAIQKHGRRREPLCAGVEELVRGCRRVVVVAPHPDDETLGVGGLLSVLLKRGFPVEVIMVTDGEASHASMTPEVMRTVRVLENALALRQLGWTRPNVHRLRLPDSKVATQEDVLVRQLERLLRAGDRVLTTWRHDGHPDHEATARAVMRVAASKQCVCAQFPVWGRSHMLLGEAARASEHVCRYHLDGAALMRKCRALKRYRSQLVAVAGSDEPPVVPPAMVNEFLVPFEVLWL